MQWQLGDVKVSLFRELQTAVPLEGLLPAADRTVLDENVSWLKPHFLNDDGTLPLSIHALVLESMGQVIVVDTCVGSRPVPGFESMSFMQSALLADMSSAGYDPERVDTVFCTHLHFDHVGWNTRLVDGKWVPTFPHARYLFGRIEYDYWASGADGAAVTFGDAVAPVLDAGLADLVEMDHRVNDEIWFEPTPGHTPGHMSVRISSGGVDAVITGDMVHHPVQFVAPQWRMSADDDAPRASDTRRAFRDRYVDGPVRIFGTHFAGPSTGYLKRNGDSFKFVV